MLEDTDNWLGQEHECAHCGWGGCGVALVPRSLTSDFSEMLCPRCEETVALALVPGAYGGYRSASDLEPAPDRITC